MLPGRHRCRQRCHGRWRSVVVSRRTWLARRCGASRRGGRARVVTRIRLSRLFVGRSDLVLFPAGGGARRAACAAATGRPVLPACAAACACEEEAAKLQHCDSFQVFGVQASGLLDQAGPLAAVVPRVSTRLSDGLLRVAHAKPRLPNTLVQVDLRTRLALPAGTLWPGRRRGGATRGIGSATGRAHRGGVSGVVVRQPQTAPDDTGQPDTAQDGPRHATTPHLQ